MSVAFQNSMKRQTAIQLSDQHLTLRLGSSSSALRTGGNRDWAVSQSTFVCKGLNPFLAKRPDQLPCLKKESGPREMARCHIIVAHDSWHLNSVLQDGAVGSKPG